MASKHGPDSLVVETTLIDDTELKQLASIGTIDGVAILHVGGKNGTGTGVLRSVTVATRLSWKAPGSSSYGTYVDCSVDGEYVLVDGDDDSKYVRVYVYNSHLSSTPEEGNVYLQDLINNETGSDNVSAAEATAGDVKDYTVAIRNSSGVVVSPIKFWLDPSTSDLEISDDGAVWVSPTTEGTALDWGELNPGSARLLHMRRTIAAAASSDTEVLNLLQYSFDGL